MINTFQEYLANTSAQIPIGYFIINLIVAAVLSYILSFVYIKYGNSLSNRKQFSRNFVMMTLITMLIISIVKSSLALSLGLVGALSIIRFRAAIKEPEELVYLFLTISIGLGFGANQGLITTIAFIIMTSIIILMKKHVHKIDENQSLHLIVRSNKPNEIDMNIIIDIIKTHCISVNLKRFDKTEKAFELAFIIELANFKQLNETKIALEEFDSEINITFLDNKGSN